MELFAASLRSEPWSWHALAIAICLYGSIFAIRSRSVLAASILLAIAVFALVWQLTRQRSITARPAEPPLPGSSLRHPLPFLSPL